MSNYTKSTNFATKDNLTPGDPLKIVRGTEIDTEFNNIATAIATKTDNSAAAITGGSITGITDLAIADGGTGASTATAAINNLLPSQTSNANKYLQTDGTNVSWDAVSLSTSDITGTLPVANGGTGVTSSTGTGSVVLSNSPTLVTPALGTPASGTLTNATGLPISTDVSGLGTGVATFFATPSSANLRSALTDETGTGSAVFANSPTLVTPALGTPSSGTLTNATGLPISTGVSGLGTGVATALAVNVGSAGAPVVNGGALGTPSSGTVTNLTGTASININGTVGATTPTTGAFTTLAASSSVTLSGGTANGVTYLNGSKVLTTGSVLTFDGTRLTSTTGKFGFGAASNSASLMVNNATNTATGIQLFQDGIESWIMGMPANSAGLAWSASGSEQMRLTSTGLGIGTSSPASLTKLTVFQDSTFAVQLMNSSQNYTLRVDAGASDALILGNRTSFTDLLAISTSGNLGLGVTPSSTIWSGDETRLVVKGNGASKAGVLALQSQGTTNATTAFFVAEDLRAGASLGTSTNSFLALLTNGTERARIDASGNLGIGTSSPATQLDVASNTGTEIVTRRNGGRTVNTYADAVNAILAYSTGALRIGETTSTVGANFTERMRLDSAGNLGLGVTPSAWGNTYRAVEIGSLGSGIAVPPSNGNINVVANAYNNNTSWIYGSSSYAGRYSIQASTGAHAWYTAASGTAGNAISFTQAMTLDASGNLLVGVTSQFAGADCKIQAKNSSISQSVAFLWNATTSGDANFVAFGTEASVTQRGSITYNRTAGLTAYNTTSDYRAKDISGPVTDSGALIDSVPVYMGKMKGATQERPMFIAHETPEYAHTGEKDAVDADGNPVYQQMDASALIPVMWAEIKSLRARVAQLESN